ncbi:peroxiredoxin [Stakelama saccharophila]|uniref:thioredoxin-dependent peroxiredoxin n=1 Tax=Stakelama saccharophila TaxID=3075605 RepID=A0ABZ0BCA4_9SPHN|nr:peroxiredoxin [Stakelama sp. W311]WNO54918.1 peroxiredoxin [Stakelama sp. W311]
MAIGEGDPLPAVTLEGSDGTAVDLRDYRGKPLVLYFYPRDDTSGCTREASEFSAALDRFDRAGVRVLGVSKDSAEKHRKFAAKHDLTVPLATDADGSVCDAFGVWVEKNMYGRKSMGIERSTFLFDAGGALVKSWRKVRVPGHVDAVLEAVEALPAA